MSTANVMNNLKQKMQTLRDELDKYRDLYEEKCRELEREKTEKTDVENEVTNLTRRIRLLEDEKDQIDYRYYQVNQKLNDASKIVDEYERVQRASLSRQDMDDDKITSLQDLVKSLKSSIDVAERKCEEAMRKLNLAESELERAEGRRDMAESKVRQLDGSLHILASNMKSLEISEQTLANKEEGFENTISSLNKRLRESETTSEMLYRELRTKEVELEKTEKHLLDMQAEYRLLREELDSCYGELVSL